MKIHMSIYAIYFNPSDQPGKFVVRRHDIVEEGGQVGSLPAPEAVCAETLGEARQHVPPGLVQLPRFNDDDPVIVETWL